GDVPNSPSVSIGRFYPDHFHFVSGNVQDACTGFSYMSQPAMTFSYQLQARNLGDEVTTNYTSPGYLEAATINYHAENDNTGDGDNLDSRVVVTGGSWDDGVWDLNVTDAMFLRRAHQTLGAPARELDGPLMSLQF